MTKIMTCSCEHEYQDKKYGKYKRVFNKKAKPGTGGIMWHCTVCGKGK